MKKIITAICFHACVLIFAAICKSQPTNTFGIYLTAEPVGDRILEDGKFDWLHVKLQSTPIISEADILAYDFTNHSVSLKPDVLEGAFKRLPRISVFGLPFILVVDGERIYLGAFMTTLSSASTTVPCIDVPLISKPENTLRIERAYPGSCFGVGPDPRSDERIRRALEALHKLK